MKIISGILIHAYRIWFFFVFREHISWLYWFRDALFSFIGMGVVRKDLVLKWVILTLGLLLFLLPFVSSYFPSESNARLNPPFYHFICSSNSTVMVQKENKLIFRGIYTLFMSFDFHFEDLILYKGILHITICFSSHSYKEWKNQY